MEELIGILVLVVLFIVKVIDKKFSNASEKSPQRVDQREAFPKVELRDTVEEVKPKVYHVQELKPRLTPVPKQKPEPKQKPLQTTIPKAKQMLQEENEKTREKIDPKKLVVYSEIMNRKY